MTATLPPDIAASLGLRNPGDSVELEVQSVGSDGSVTVDAESENENMPAPPPLPPEIQNAIAGRS